MQIDKNFNGYLIKNDSYQTDIDHLSIHSHGCKRIHETYLLIVCIEVRYYNTV